MGRVVNEEVVVERYTLREAQDHLQELIQDAQAGKTVVILGEQDQAVQLVPLSVIKKPRRPGSARGQIIIAPDFDAPLAG